MKMLMPQTHCIHLRVSLLRSSVNCGWEIKPQGRGHATPHLAICFWAEMQDPQQFGVGLYRTSSSSSAMDGTPLFATKDPLLVRKAGPSAWRTLGLRMTKLLTSVRHSNHTAVSAIPLPGGSGVPARSPSAIHSPNRLPYTSPLPASLNMGLPSPM